MKRAERRYRAMGEARALKTHISQHWPQFRLPGSLKPFHRINGLVEAVVKAANDVERAVAHRALAGYQSRGHGRTLSYGRMV